MKKQLKKKKNKKFGFDIAESISSAFIYIGLIYRG